MRLVWAGGFGTVLGAVEVGIIHRLDTVSSETLTSYVCLTLLLVLISDLGASLAENRSGPVVLTLIGSAFCHGVVLFIIVNNPTGVTSVLIVTGLGMFLGVVGKMIETLQKPADRLIGDR